MILLLSTEADQDLKKELGGKFLKTLIFCIISHVRLLLCHSPTRFLKVNQFSTLFLAEIFLTIFDSE